ncbi:hypothetical protein DSO57_1028155 [Entomophthora muscae]|uniref:Uncharacterized protein n=1 Tax=Entomophthora muscae TaxID=34485 RepID=A0ACC2T1M1_9FUNG|nr:hypothetical protein DSO57_1028155 [Entomophthora muscae]
MNYSINQPNYWSGNVSPVFDNSSSTSPIPASFVPMDHLTLAPLSWSRHATHATRLPSILEILSQPHLYTPTLPSVREWSSFNAAAGNPEWKPSAMPKRPRRRFHEVERKYGCTFPGCGKAYGALNHLNAHIVSRSHGRRRKAREFVSQ